MVGRRRGGRGVVRGVARTAVVAGTFTATSMAVGNRMEQRQQRKATEQEAMEQYQQSQQSPPPQEYPPQQYPPQAAEAVPYQPVAVAAPATTDGDDDVAAKLQQLVELKQAGMLTDEEFSAAKARLLSS